MDKEQILDFFRVDADRPLRMKELAKAFGVDDSSYTNFRKLVKDLIDSGELVKLKGGRIGLAKDLNVLTGNISINRKGVGYLERSGEAEDLLIPQNELHTALDGDRVMVRLTGKHFGREAGSVIRVLDRADRNIVGVFRTGRSFHFVVPDNPRIHRDIYIPASESKKAKDGEKVVAVLTAWDHPWLNPEGKVIERLGYPGQPGVDMRAVIKSFNLPEEFPPEVLDAAERAAAKLTKDEMAGRLDLSQECIYTIDPSDAKDHDDAVSVEKTNTGYKLGVHIADVSFFVEPGSPLDDEAFERGNSVYLPGMVIPMLPENLSNDVCSLKPNRKRLSHSAFMEFDKKGKMTKWSFADTVIKSKAKLSYEEVQAFFDGGKVPERVKRVADNLTAARELAQLLTRRRMAEGSLDFDLPEAKIILNQKGEVLELGHKIRLESHRLVEEFMLAANKAVAREVFRQGRPFLYRVHDKPDLEKLEAFAYMMKRLGYNFVVSKTMRPKDFSRFLDDIKDAPEADFINELMLRSMKKAVYQRDNIGHFGLAFTHYTHFTSPIRRYPDLLVHRLLRTLRKKKFNAAFTKRVINVIDHVGDHCSETERQAEAAERQAVKVKQVAYMANRLGEEYQGVISGVTSYGFFVRLDNLGVEGLVKMSTMDDDFYRYEEGNYRLIGRRKGRTFRLGDAVRVGVLSVDTIAGEIDLFLPEEARKPAKKPPGKHSGKPMGKRGKALATLDRKTKGKPKGKGKDKGKSKDKARAKAKKKKKHKRR
ncbi:ribonuclease R [candidate division GN15 bacterium]|nr:ribonuclease R [candidate division GN15 bacterium]